MSRSSFATKLLKWYHVHKRDLPWRETQNPYLIWISEIILQQTRVDQGLPYYYRFIENFPSVQHLAQASEQDVLSTWQGLGYYSRARNLHAAAKQIAFDLNGKFPTSYQDWLNIKGVGSYTAAAIASFYQKEKVPVLDGNVFRVLARIKGIDEDILSNKGKKIFWETSLNLMPDQEADLYNQAIMEFGALHCTPKNPHCHTCPFQKECFAFEKDLIADLPVKLKKLKRTSRYFHFLVYRFQEQMMLIERTKKDIWQGLHQFPLLELPENELPSKKTLENCQFTTNPIKHVLSHQDLYCTFYDIPVKNKTQWNTLLVEWNAKSYAIKDTPKIPKPILLTNFLNTHFFSNLDS
jgi:A/G-specific adenine glycosylase